MPDKDTAQKKPLSVGGQAVIEGVMMRSPWRVATAVRDPEGFIRVKSAPHISIAKTHRIAKLPVIRGVVGLYEAMKIGIASLNWSAEIAGEEERRDPTFWERVGEVLLFIFSFVIGIGLFMAVPYFVAGLAPQQGNQVIFHLIAGGLRIFLLIGYMGAISFIPDIKRVFQYHGGEHKSIFTFEKGQELTAACAKRESRFHPRCGTSFLILAALLTMVGFMAFDTLWVAYVSDFHNLFHRIAIHLPVIPLIAGLSYEVLRLVEKHSENPFWQPFVLPGFWLQRITTREPDETQLEVALAALKESLREDEEAYDGFVRDENSEVAVEEEEPLPEDVAAMQS